MHRKFLVVKKSTIFWSFGYYGMLPSQIAYYYENDQRPN
jgi:hypothetical protein